MVAGFGVHQNDPIPFLPQRLARLSAGIVELARLPDYDGTGAKNEDGFYVVAFRHGRGGLSRILILRFFDQVFFFIDPMNLSNK